MISFADEEGSRFNTPTLGSRALVGKLDVDDAIDRVDDHGVTLGDAMAEAGVVATNAEELAAWAASAGVPLERTESGMRLTVQDPRNA